MWLCRETRTFCKNKENRKRKGIEPEEKPVLWRRKVQAKKEERKEAGSGNATDGEMNRGDCRCQKEIGNLRHRRRGSEATHSYFLWKSVFGYEEDDEERMRRQKRDERRSERGFRRS